MKVEMNQEQITFLRILLLGVIKDMKHIADEADFSGIVEACQQHSKLADSICVLIERAEKQTTMVEGEAS